MSRSLTRSGSLLISASTLVMTAAANGLIGIFARTFFNPSPAGEGLKNVLAKIPIKPFAAAVITNVEAEINSDPERVKDLLIRQTVSPVRWEETVRKLEQLGCERIYEVG